MKNTGFEKTIFDMNKGFEMTSADENAPETVDAGETAENSESDDDASYSEFLELLSRIKEMNPDSDDDDDDADDSEDDDDDDDTSTMDADDYHNKAVHYARQDKYSKSLSVCLKGLEKYPLNIDLLADTITYSCNVGDREQAARYYGILKKNIPFKRWNWRAYTFSFDFLIEADPEANEKECRTLVENYRKYLPYEEKADMAESQLETALGNTDESMKVLENALRIHTNASQCALRLADMQMERGLYSDVIATTTYGIAASAEAQPSISIPYIYYLRTLAKDYILHKKECVGETISAEEVTALKEEYELLLSEFPEFLHYKRNVTTRLKMLKFVKTV